jgi:TolA-binding protein
MRALLIAAALLLSTPFLLAGDDLLPLHNQVQDLTDKVSKLQLSLDENIGVMTDLVNRNAETTGRMEHDVKQLQDQTQQQNTSVGAQFGKISSQVTTLQTELGELESRLEAVTQAPLAPAASPAQPAPVAAQAPPAQALPVQPPVQTPTAPAPPPEPPPTAPPEPASGADLYRSAMEHYGAKDFEIAAGEFTKFLKADRQSENAINAQFYLAEIEFEDKDFEGALEDYTAVGPRLSDQAKAARAQYRKALCLIEVDRQDEAILELQAVKDRFPRSNEAVQAAKKLHTLGVRGTPRP